MNLANHWRSCRFQMENVALRNRILFQMGNVVHFTTKNAKIAIAPVLDQSHLVQRPAHVNSL